jgi:lipoprotein NlpI
LTRLQQLQQFFSDDPNDPFNLYALAIEYQKTDVQKSMELFLTLTAEHPKYIPTYYHLGKLLQEIGELKNAQTVFETGIRFAQELNEVKAVRELKAALQELEDEL